jgi:hypothetical protein
MARTLESSELLSEHAFGIEGSMLSPVGCVIVKIVSLFPP